jgi:hypothetical protein
MNMTVLGFLSLTSPVISGTSPAELGGITSMLSLSLQQTMRLSGTIPASYSSLSSTQFTYLSTRVSGTIPVWAANPGLTRVMMAGSSLSGTLPLAITNMRSLQTAIWYNTRLSGTLPDLSLSTRLALVLQQSSQLSGTMPASFPEQLRIFISGVMPACANTS